MNRHAGQWALPGGKIDDGETVEMAALREVEEELGLSIDPSQILGTLDDYATRSGFVITPIVVWGGADVVLRPDPREVAHVIRVGLRELCRARFASVRVDSGERSSRRAAADRSRPDPRPDGCRAAAVPLGRRRRMVDARVNEFEQPVFAWQ